MAVGNQFDIRFGVGQRVPRKEDGRLLSGGGRYTDIWAKRGGRWLCVAAQVARN